MLHNSPHRRSPDKKSMVIQFTVHLLSESILDIYNKHTNLVTGGDKQKLRQAFLLSPRISEAARKQHTALAWQAGSLPFSVTSRTWQSRTWINTKKLYSWNWIESKRAIRLSHCSESKIRLSRMVGVIFITNLFTGCSGHMRENRELNQKWFSRLEEDDQCM